MRLFVETMANNIIQETTRRAGTYRYVLPSFPSSVLVELGKDLEEQFNRAEIKIDFEYGVAYKLGQKWISTGDNNDQKNYKIIKQAGWYNETDNLTEIRNKVREPQYDVLVIILAGYEHINDQASLSDFFRLDNQSTWELYMKESYKNWLHIVLRNKIDPEDHKSEVEKINGLLFNLNEHGLAGALDISYFLESIDFDSVMTGKDAYKVVLSNLNHFKLPCMIGLSRQKGKKAISDYIKPAQQFLNYSLYIEARKRREHLDKVREVINNPDKIDPAEESLGDYNSLTDLLVDLEKYIEARDESKLERLSKVDFIFIYDTILGYKKRKNRISIRTNVKKMYGLPPEVFLRAIWLTIADFQKSNELHASELMEYINNVTICSTNLKYYFENSDEFEEDKTEEGIAKNFLRQVLGGIDDFIQNNLNDLAEKYDISFNSLLEPSGKNEKLSFSKTVTSSPALRFSVVISSENGKRFPRHFMWLLPAHHHVHLLRELFSIAHDGFSKSYTGDPLPAIAIPHMAEIFRATEEEEICRLLGTSLRKENCKMIDLLNVVEGYDEVKLLLKVLSYDYQEFVKSFKNNGLFYALNNEYETMRKSYEEAFKKYIGLKGSSPLGPQLLKSFMVVNLEEAKHDNWAWDSHLDASIVTPLHPSVLEMMKHQHRFLFESFCYYINILPEERRLTEKRWNQVVDLANIQWPVFGTLKSMSQELDTNVRSYEWLHLVGDCQDKSSFIDLRTLTKEAEDEEEDDITETELFRETKASKLIHRTLMEYHDLYYFASDGISIGAYSGKEIQPIISGIDAYLNDLLKNRGVRGYSFHLTIFSDAKDDSTVMQWVDAWKDRFQAAEYSSGKKHYAECDISIAYRVVSKEKENEQFKRLLENTELDMLFFADFVEASASRLSKLNHEHCLEGIGYSKFPILEKACCRITGGGKDKQRYRILSNRRFQVGPIHTEVMALLKGISGSDNTIHAVTSVCDFEPWVDLIDIAHERSNWVVCIAPAIDEKLIEDNKSKNKSREIIGFGSGVGIHGESNYTISSEKFAVTDIKSQIASQVASLLGPWKKDDCFFVAEVLIDEASKISGLSMVQATGPERYVRELIAHSMVRKILLSDSDCFCDEIISLDAYSHWFDDADVAYRPDLLRVTAVIENGLFSINAQIIECKLAHESEGYLEKAREQIENGLRQLVYKFMPRKDDRPEGLEGAPDQRYWWSQLHRLIASKSETRFEDFNDTLLALEKLSEGCFNITWQASAVAFWVDVENDYLRCQPEWSFNLGDQSIVISVASAGRNFIKKACLEDVSHDLFCDDLLLEFRYNQAHGTFKKTADNISSHNDYEQDDLAAEYEKDSFEKLTDRGEFSFTKDSVTADKLQERICLGTLASGGRNIFWEFGHKELPNRHILVFGASGEGKTYTIQAILFELGKAGLNSLIIDYTDGFTKDQLETSFAEKANPKQHYIRKEPLSINPFREQFDYIDGEVIHEGPAYTSQRVAGVFSDVYYLGEQQRALLYNVIKEGIQQENNKFDFNRLTEKLGDKCNAGGATTNSASSLLNKIQPFVDMNPFGVEDPDSWENVFSDLNSKCHVIQLTGFVKDAAKLITEFSLFDLYWYYRTRGRKDKPKVIVLDEIQNLSHKLERPLGRFLTEGRKFGISLILATQTLSNLDKDERDRLFQASHKLFFKPADTELKSFAQILSNSTGDKTEAWIERLSALKRGECYSLGPAYNEVTGKLEVNRWFKTQITPLEGR